MPGATGGQFVTKRLQAIVSADSNMFTQQMGASTAALKGFKAQIAATSAALTAFSTGALAIGTAQFAEFSDEMTQSLAIMDRVGPRLRGTMNETARQVALQTRKGASQAAQSYFYLASAGMDAAQSMRALPQVAQFAQAGMFDFKQATDLATDAQTALGLSSENARQNLHNLTRVTDVLVKANTLANATVEQFSESLTNKLGARLRIVNKDIEEGVAALAAFADQGRKGRLAGRTLNIILRDLSKRAVKNKEGFQDLGIEVFNAQGELKAIANIVREFEEALGGLSIQQQTAALEQLNLNRRAEDGIIQLIGLADKIEGYRKQLEQAQGTTREVAKDQMDSLNAQLEVLGSHFEEIAMQIGSNANPEMRGLVRTLISATDWLIRFNEQAGGAVTTVLEFGALGGLTATLTSLFGPAGLIITGATAFGTLAAAAADAKHDTREFSSQLHEMVPHAEDAEAAIKRVKQQMSEMAQRRLQVSYRQELMALRREKRRLNAQIEETEAKMEAGKTGFLEYGGAADTNKQILKALESQLQDTKQEIANIQNELAGFADGETPFWQFRRDAASMRESVAQSLTGLRQAARRQQMDRQFAQVAEQTQLAGNQMEFYREQALQSATETQAVTNKVRQLPHHLRRINGPTRQFERRLRTTAGIVTNTLVRGFRQVAVEGANATEVFKAMGQELAFSVTKALVLKGIMTALNISTGGGAAAGGSILSSLIGLQSGGVISEPTTAVLGEGSQPEVVAPLRDFQNFAEEIADSVRPERPTADRQVTVKIAGDFDRFLDVFEERRQRYQTRRNFA